MESLLLLKIKKLFVCVNEQFLSSPQWAAIEYRISVLFKGHERMYTLYITTSLSGTTGKHSIKTEQQKGLFHMKRSITVREENSGSRSRSSRAA